MMCAVSTLDEGQLPRFTLDILQLCVNLLFIGVLSAVMERWTSSGGLIGPTDVSNVIGDACPNLYVKGKKWEGKGKEGKSC